MFELIESAGEDVDFAGVESRPIVFPVYQLQRYRFLFPALFGLSAGQRNRMRQDRSWPYFDAGLSPAQVACGHRVNDQPDIVVEPNGGLLPDTSYFPHRMLTPSWGLR